MPSQMSRLPISAGNHVTIGCCRPINSHRSIGIGDLGARNSNRACQSGFSFIAEARDDSHFMGVVSTTTCQCVFGCR